MGAVCRRHRAIRRRRSFLVDAGADPLQLGATDHKHAADRDRRISDSRRQDHHGRAGCRQHAVGARAGADFEPGFGHHARHPDAHLAPRDRSPDAARTRAAAGQNLCQPQDRKRQHHLRRCQLQLSGQQGAGAPGHFIQDQRGRAGRDHRAGRFGQNDRRPAALRLL